MTKLEVAVNRLDESGEALELLGLMAATAPVACTSVDAFVPACAHNNGPQVRDAVNDKVTGFLRAEATLDQLLQYRIAV